MKIPEKIMAFAARTFLADLEDDVQAAAAFDQLMAGRYDGLKPHLEIGACRVGELAYLVGDLAHRLQAACQSAVIVGIEGGLPTGASIRGGLVTPDLYIADYDIADPDEEDTTVFTDPDTGFESSCVLRDIGVDDGSRGERFVRTVLEAERPHAEGAGRAACS